MSICSVSHLFTMVTFNEFCIGDNPTAFVTTIDHVRSPHRKRLFALFVGAFLYAVIPGRFHLSFGVFAQGW